MLRARVTEVDEVAVYRADRAEGVDVIFIFEPPEKLGSMAIRVYDFRVSNIGPLRCQKTD